MERIVIFRTFHIITSEYTFFSPGTHRTFSRIEHILGHKPSHGKFNKIEIPSIFSDHNPMKLDINYREKIVKSTSTCRLNNTYLNTKRSLKKSKRKQNNT